MTRSRSDAAEHRLLDVFSLDQKATQGFEFHLLKDIGNTPVFKRNLIKGVMARGETSAWIGPPGSMKSALMAEASICVSSGIDWHGKKNKGAAGVVYFALERADLVVRRWTAHLERDGFNELPIAIVNSLVNLMTPKTVPAIVSTIRSAELCFGLPVGLVIFDTFGKLIAAGGGDEDKAKDQGMVFANIQLIKNEIDVHIALVGHTGKDETRGSRGSNAILGDVDLMVTITGDGIKTATVTKANDMPEGPLFSFKSDVHEFGVDADGDILSVNIISDAPIDGNAAQGGRARNLSKGASTCLRALRQAVVECGHVAPSLSTGIPDGQRVVTRNNWRQIAYRFGISASRNERARQQAFARGVDALVSLEAVKFKDDYFWPVSSENTGERRTPL